MAGSDQLPLERPAATRRHRWAWITVFTIGIVSGSALLAVPAIAAGSSNSSGHRDRVIVCESGVVDQGEIQTSSAVAVRVGDDAPVPDGCEER